MASFLIFAAADAAGNLAAAQARSAQQAQAMGCVAPTVYWWPIITNPASGQPPGADAGQAALVIAGDGDYGPGGLTSFELAALTPGPLDPSWFPVPPTLGV